MAATPATPPNINPKKLRSRIKKQIPQPKQHKWTQIGAKAIGGDAGALARLTKRGLIGANAKAPKGKTPSGKTPKGPKAPKAPSSGSSTDTTITGYKPPAITDKVLEAGSPKLVSPGVRKDAITGLDVNVDFGPNPYHPGGGTAAQKTPTAPKDPDIASQPVGRRRAIKRLGKALDKAQKQGNEQKVKRIRKHLRQLRRLGPGERLSKPTVKELATQKQAAKKGGRSKEAARLSDQIKKIRRSNRNESVVNTGKKGGSVLFGLDDGRRGIAGQTQFGSEITKKKKKK